MCSPKNIKHKILGRLNSMRSMNSTLKRSSVEVLGGLVAFRPVPLIGKWVLCLLLLRDGDGLSSLFGDTSVSNGGEMSVCYFEFVSSLDSGGGEAASGGGFLDEEEIKDYNKQDEGCERVEHESRGKGQALSFCQRLIQLGLRSRLKQQCLLSEGT